MPVTWRLHDGYLEVELGRARLSERLERCGGPVEIEESEGRRELLVGGGVELLQLDPRVRAGAHALVAVCGTAAREWWAWGGRCATRGGVVGMRLGGLAW